MIVSGGSRYNASCIIGTCPRKTATTYFPTKLGTGLDKLGGISHESESLEAVKVLGEQRRLLMPTLPQHPRLHPQRGSEWVSLSWKTLPRPSNTSKRLRLTAFSFSASDSLQPRTRRSAIA